TAAKALVWGGGVETAAGLFQAGYILESTRFSIAARAYCQASVEIYEALYRHNPENVAIANGLGRALKNLGNLLRPAGRVADAERAYRRSVEISEILYRQN